MLTPLLTIEYVAAVLVVPLAAASVYCAVKRWYVIYRFFSLGQSLFHRRTRAISVNCHFCNENSYVPATHWNAFYCPHCDQYNGFTKVRSLSSGTTQHSRLLQDGDYNRLEPEMYREPMTPMRYATTDEDYYKLKHGGVQLCPMCTSRTAQKQLCIARFEPSNEVRVCASG